MDHFNIYMIEELFDPSLRHNLSCNSRTLPGPIWKTYNRALKICLETQGLTLGNDDI